MAIKDLEIPNTVPDRSADPETFLASFEKLASSYRWFFLDGYKVRTRIAGETCCPLMAAGHYANKEVPSQRNIADACKSDFKTASCIIQNADCIVSGRHYQPDIRNRLLKACKLEEPTAAAVEQEEATLV